MEPVDNWGSLWTPESSAHPVHRPWGVLPSAVPSFPQVPHSPNVSLGVTAFTRPGERGCFVAEQWTAVWRSCGQPALPCGLPVDNRRAPCGRKVHPQPVEIFYQQFHKGLTWGDDLSARRPVDTFRITRQSPPCGREIIPQSVENPPPKRSNRTARSAYRRRGGPGQPPSKLPGTPEQPSRSPRAAVEQPSPKARDGPLTRNPGRATPPRPGYAEGRPGRCPGAPFGGAADAVRQPFLMRLVSSVTWL